MGRCRLVFCGYLAIFMSAGVSSTVDCGSWVAAFYALLVCGGDMCDVVLMVVPARGGFFREHFWGMAGVIGCLWWVSPTPLGQAFCRCLVVPVLFGWVFLWQSLPWVGMSCIHRACSFGGQVVCGLWLPGFCCRPLLGFGGCVASVVPVWCGLVFFSL